MLKIRTDFESANVWAPPPQSDGGPDTIYFMPHPHGGPETLWFNFIVENTDEANVGKPLDLTLLNVTNILGGHMPALLRPVMAVDGGEFARLPAPTIDTRPDGVINATWRTTIPKQKLQLAICYPYTTEEFITLGEDIDWQSSLIGLSQGGQGLMRLANRFGTKGDIAPALYCIARQHSGETPGSWVLDGFLRRIHELADAAPMCWAVPLSNIDGVTEGDYGKDNFPYDLNRAWGRPAMRHEVQVMIADTRRWKQRCRTGLIIDFHAPGACETDGVYTFIADPEKFPERHAANQPFVEAVHRHLADLAAPEFARVANYPSRWNTPTLTAFAWDEHRLPALTLEIPYSLIGDRLFTIDLYREAGRRIADGACEALSSLKP